MRQEKFEELKSYIEELKTIEVLSKKPIMEGFLSLEEITLKLNNGKIITRNKLLKGKNKKNGNAVIILPITKEGNVILTVQPRVFTKKTVGIELPAGYIEPGEAGIVTAQRELEEETGYIPESLEFLTNYYQDQGCSGALNECYLATGCKKVANQNLDKDEYIHYFECTYDEMLELVDLDYIQDAGSKITIYEANKKVRKRILELKNADKI